MRRRRSRYSASEKPGWSLSSSAGSGKATKRGHVPDGRAQAERGTVPWHAAPSLAATQPRMPEADADSRPSAGSAAAQQLVAACTSTLRDALTRARVQRLGAEAVNIGDARGEPGHNFRGYHLHAQRRLPQRLQRRADLGVIRLALEVDLELSPPRAAREVDRRASRKQK